MNSSAFNTCRNSVEGLGKSVMIVLAFAWVFAGYIFFTTGTFFTAVTSLILFTILGPISAILGDKFRSTFGPDFVLTSSTGDLVKTKIFWSIGPQSIGIIVAIVISGLALTTENAAQNNGMLKDAITKMNDSSQIINIEPNQVKLLNEYVKKFNLAKNTPREKFEKREKYNTRIKKAIDHTVNALSSKGFNNNDVCLVKGEFIDSFSAENVSTSYDLNSEMLQIVIYDFKYYNSGTDLNTIPGKIENTKLIDAKILGDIIDVPMIKGRTQEPRAFTVPFSVEQAKKFTEIIGDIDKKNPSKIKVSFLMRLFITPDFQSSVSIVNRSKRTLDRTPVHALSWEIVRVIIN